MQNKVKFTTIYKTDADYFETLNKMNSDSRIGSPEESEKGHLYFRFREPDLAIELVESTGTLIVYWHNEREKEKYYPLLQDVLVRADGSPAKIHPLRTNIYNIPYPGPEKFTLAWCKEIITYVKSLGFWGFLKWLKVYNDEKEERRISEIKARIAKGLEDIDPELGEWGRKRFC